MPPGGTEAQAFEASDNDVAPAPAHTPAPAVIVVSDAGPLISLGRLDLIGLLGALFAKVLVPEAVIRECLARSSNPDALRIRQALAQGHLVACPTPLQTLAGLDAGESAAIVHAQAIGAAVLLDKRAGRQRALAMGLMVTGTLGVLVRARQRNLVGPIAPLIAELRASGQRLSQPVVLHALAVVGEAAT